MKLSQLKFLEWACFISTTILFLYWLYYWNKDFTSFSYFQNSVVNWTNWCLLLFGVGSFILYFKSLDFFESETKQTLILVKKIKPFAIGFWSIFSLIFIWLLLDTDDIFSILVYGVVPPLGIIILTEGIFIGTKGPDFDPSYDLRIKRSQYNGYVAIVPVILIILASLVLEIKEYYA